MQVANSPIVQPSPISYGHTVVPSELGVVHGMDAALRFDTEERELQRWQCLGIADASCLSRLGVKGPNAAQWLTEHQLDLPERPNSWTATSSGVLVLRLGSTEYLIEDGPDTHISSSLSSDPPQALGIYPVRRADASFVITGNSVQELFAEVCSLDLCKTALDANALVMTQLAGIAATVLRQPLNGGLVYRLWCDGTYGTYLWHTLTEIAQELGGGAVGVSSYFKELA